MTSPIEALAALKADMAHVCAPNPETQRVIRAVPKLLAIAEAAAAWEGARQASTAISTIAGRKESDALVAALASLTSEENND